MHQCENIITCNFANFGPIFTKFAPKCKPTESGRLFTILGSFCSFLDWKGADIRPKNWPRKVPVCFNIHKMDQN